MNKQTKQVLVDNILNNTVYLPTSGMRLMVEKALLKKLTLSELNALDVITGCKAGINSTPDIRLAKKDLTNIANHLGEHSLERIKSDIMGVVEEIL